MIAIAMGPQNTLRVSGIIASTVAAAVLVLVAGPLSRLVLGYRDIKTFRIAVLGLWTFTNLELAYGLLRVDERIRTYAVASLINVGLTVAASLVLVVGYDKGVRGLLLGNYGASTLVLFGLWWTMRGRLLRRRPGGERLPRLLRFAVSALPLCVQPVSATPLVVYRLAFGSPRSFADVD